MRYQGTEMRKTGPSPALSVNILCARIGAGSSEKRDVGSVEGDGQTGLGARAWE